MPAYFRLCHFFLLALAAAGTISAPCFGEGRIEPLLGFWPSGISGDGTVVVGTGYRDNGNEPVIWRRGQLQYLGKLGNDHTYARAISDDGTVVVGEDYSVVGYRWTQANGYENIEGTDIPFDLTADGGSIVGYSTRPNDENEMSNGGASLWTPGEGLSFLGALAGGGETVSAQAITPDGSVVVGFGYRNPQGIPEAFRWTQDFGAIGLGDLPGGDETSRALAVSADGSIVVGHGRAEVGQEAFRWTAATGMQGLGHRPNYVDTQYAGSAATVVAPDGSFILGHDSIGTYETVAFYWDAADGMRPLADVLGDEFGIDLTGWHLASVTAISADGSTIIGMGRFGTSTDLVGWRAELVPEPSSVSIASIAALVLFGSPIRSRRRQSAFGQL